jgi:AbrB family looped-hinge helix DNA binding protein
VKETTRLSSKGQVILPKSVRDACDWKPGTEFFVEPTSEGVLLRPRTPFAATRLRDVLGCAGYRGQRKSVEDMQEAIKKGVAARHAGRRY